MFSEDDEPSGSHSEIEANRKSRILEDSVIDKIVITGGCCWLCGYSDDATMLEGHHIAGRRNSSATIPVCPICHKILSRAQYSWPKEWTFKDNTTEFRLALIERSFIEMSKVKAKAIESIRKEQRSQTQVIKGC